MQSQLDTFDSSNDTLKATITLMKVKWKAKLWLHAQMFVCTIQYLL